MSLAPWLNRIHLGDCLKLMAQLPEGSVDLVVTSPPYNLRRSSGGGMRNGSGGLWEKARLLDGYAGGYGDDMPRPEYIKWQRECLHAMMRLLPDTGAIFYNHKRRVQDGLEEDPRLDILYDFPVRQTIIWQRAGGINFNLSYFLPTYEVIYLICKTKKFRLAKSKDPKRPKKACGVGDIWSVPQESNNVHPAPFPLEIPKRCIEATDARVVLDPFIGSGTTAIAAEMLGREWIGMEAAKQYVKQAKKRLADCGILER
jgi:site-specific DNA-methyltransferase (adenine-specific)